MRHQVAGNPLSRPANQRQALYKSLIRNLFTSGRMVTSKAKAKAVAGEADKLINLLKEQSLNGRREAEKLLSYEMVENLSKNIPARFASRNSGYTRIVNLGQRLSDTTRMVYMELIEDVKKEQSPAEKPAKKEAAIKEEVKEKPEEKKKPARTRKTVKEPKK